MKSCSQRVMSWESTVSLSMQLRLLFWLARFFQMRSSFVGSLKAGGTAKGSGPAAAADTGRVSAPAVAR